MADKYLLGHSEAEMRRLVKQAELLLPITRRILLSAGVLRGMRVLDVGTGMGDVAFLVSDLVGADGSVVGIDTSDQAIAGANERLGTMSTSNVSFRVAGPRDLPMNEQYDAIVGRYVLLFQPDPASVLSALRKRLKLGGCIAFHELDWASVNSTPRASIYDQCCRWAVEALKLGGADPHVGGKLYGAFLRAGFEPPQLSMEAIIGGADDPSGTVRALFDTIMPSAFVSTLEGHGVVTAATIDAATLPDRMSSEIAAVGSTIVGRSEIGVWTRST